MAPSPRKPTTSAVLFSSHFGSTHGKVYPSVIDSFVPNQFDFTRLDLLLCACLSVVRGVRHRLSQRSSCSLPKSLSNSPPPVKPVRCRSISCTICTQRPRDCPRCLPKFWPVFPRTRTNYHRSPMGLSTFVLFGGKGLKPGHLKISHVIGGLKRSEY